MSRRPVLALAVAICAGCAHPPAAEPEGPVVVEKPAKDRPGAVREAVRGLGPGLSSAAGERALALGVPEEEDNAWHVWARPSPDDGPEPAAVLPAPWDPHRGILTVAERRRAGPHREAWRQAAARLQEGLDRPACRIVDEDARPVVAPVTLADRALAEAALAASDGEVDAGLAGLRAVLQLGRRLAACEGTLVHFGVGQLVHDHARRVAQWMLEIGLVSDEQAPGLVEEVAATAPIVATLRTALQREHERMIAMLRSEPSFGQDRPLFRMADTVAVVDEHFAQLDEVLASGERGWLSAARERLEALIPEGTPAQRAAFDRLMRTRGDPQKLSGDDLMLLSEMDNPLGRLLARSLLGGLTGILSRMQQDALVAEASVAVLRLGVERRLAGPAAEVGDDPFGGALRVDGPRVWSVGPDEEDEGGDPERDLLFVDRR